MKKVLYSSDREFQLWKYTVSHRQLLLRNVKSPAEPTRIDLLFKDVKGLNLATILHGIRIDLQGDSSGKETYRIDSSNFSGFVLASAFAHLTDDREYNDPSGFKGLDMGL
ncbi:MAG TPA: hypothetical protein VGM17_11130 [Rhizomicrobium sp.]|jgi:hypothetical protein